MATMEEATPIENLPENHIFQLVHRADQLHAADHNDDRWSDLRRPIEINAIIQRLYSPEGREETKHWVKTPLFTRLFIHQLCDCDLGGVVREGCVAGIDAESGLEAIRLALMAYPGSVRLADSAGYLPMHNICNKHFRLTDGTTNQNWHSGCKKTFTFFIREYPEAASVMTGDGKSALGLVLDSIHRDSPAEGRDRDDIIMTLLDLAPSVVKLADEDGRYPIHAEAHISSANTNIMKKLIQLFPQGLEKRCGDLWGGKIPLHSFLRCTGAGVRVESEKIIRMMLTASPSSVSIEDKSILKFDQDIDPAGDALDYVSAKYCSMMRQFNFSSLIDFDEDSDLFDEDYGRIAGGFATAHREYLENAGEQLYGAHDNVEDCERLFHLILDIARLLDGSILFRPMHASCKGRRCRPWYLATLDQIIKRYPHQARERDECSNLPLHLFLQSCMVEKEKSMLKGYIANDEEYFMAVKLCFKMILDANPDAAGEVDGDGLYPLHLAIQTCNSIWFDDILRPLLDLAPDAALVQNPETNLYPFAQALVGSASNVDNAFLLLRQNPSVIGQLG